MYVPGTLSDVEHVLVDVGTGYYVEKNVEATKEFFKRKIDFLTKQIEKIQPALQEKHAMKQALQQPEAAARSQQEAEMIVKFNTAYNIAKEEMPFTKFRSQILLQKKNGLNVNPTYSNDKSCALFIGVIADTLKKSTVEKIAAVPYLSFMIDGDTDISTKECEIVYARIMANGRPINILIGHVEVKHANAQVVIEVLNMKIQQLHSQQTSQTGTTKA
ncbi:hypothetical protein AAFF_G00320750 [Aldrovandia affinis]|uniref:Prefoldin subunit 5 n=1 Tax=Aldrovandia affinis TaxID=143900 RepID=A0AAD7W058_9TELE|nr:hypothetical protein AAFF_G00320750 [Aldrovandia affinis]